MRQRGGETVNDKQSNRQLRMPVRFHYNPTFTDIDEAIHHSDGTNDNRGISTHQKMMMKHKLPLVL